ncbi:MAG TPA: TetR/AcrR family transcriptional regulator [Propionibacteriaceae bacterium]|nr:TetR/AcrR family transcriptional regulator [Propionibacteriaceae bacterium]
MTDHRTLPRRRGDVLNSAIFEATLDELAEVGYAKLTMEKVAARAGASKASVYRRWPSRMELVLDAVHHLAPDPTETPDTGSLRGDALAFMRAAAKLLSGPGGEALRGLLGDALADPSRTLELRRHSRGTGHRIMQEIVQRAAARGEINPAAITPRRLDVAQAMLREQFLFHGPPIPDAVIVEIVDETVLPLFLGRVQTHDSHSG